MSAGTAAAIPTVSPATQIPLGSRIVSVCDAFDAMVGERPYRGARNFEQRARGARPVRRLAVRSRTSSRPSSAWSPTCRCRRLTQSLRRGCVRTSWSPQRRPRQRPPREPRRPRRARRRPRAARAAAPRRRRPRAGRRPSRTATVSSSVRAPSAASTFRVSAAAQTPPNMPVLDESTAAGLLRTGDSASGRDAQSSAFLSTPGIDELYSGVEIRIASASVECRLEPLHGVGWSPGMSSSASYGGISFSPWYSSMSTPSGAPAAAPRRRSVLWDP